jgi:hypothetical protein
MYNTSVIQGVCGVCGVWGVPCFFLEVCFQYAKGVLSVSSIVYYSRRSLSYWGLKKQQTTAKKNDNNHP